MVDGKEKTVAALMMDVNGFSYRGRLYVTNNRVKQTFDLYNEQNGMLHKENENIPYKDLGQVLDGVIETGGMSQQEHLQRLREYAKRLLA